ncbi:Collagen adhesin [Clostridiaceae bacterium JG1575]|nr:Collagen adhesin [Clostridiaceae bacterium JG1575]
MVRADGQPIKEGQRKIILTTDDKGIANIKKLPVAKYKLKEIAAPSWIDFDPLNAETIEFDVNESDDEGKELTINNSVKLTKVSVTKNWVNAPTPKPQVRVQLMRNGKEHGDPIALKDGDTKHTWSDLPVADEMGNLYEYTVQEVGTADGTIELGGNTYFVSIAGTADDGFVIENRLESNKIHVAVNKVWLDANNQDGKRPESITVKLLADGKDTGKTLMLSQENQWTGRFEDLDERASGQKIVYTVEEVKVEGYQAALSGNAKDGFTITNSYTPETTLVEGKKTWNDKDNQDGKRPEFINVTLLANGIEKETKKVTAKENWSWRFENLPVYEAGQRIAYTLKEEGVEGYSAVVDGFNITNSYTPGTVNVAVNKVWLDANNQDGKRPESITVKLLADGKDTGKTLMLSQGNQWTGRFEDLDERASGQKIVYTVEELEVAGYEPSVSGNTKNGFTITNRLKVEKTTDISIEKVWVGAPSQKPSITIRLFANGQEIDKILLKNGQTKHTFKGLPIVDQAGKLISYTIKEDHVKGYRSEVNGFTVTNTKEELPWTGTIPSSLPFFGGLMVLAGIALGRKKK